MPATAPAWGGEARASARCQPRAEGVRGQPRRASAGENFVLLDMRVTDVASGV
jgi:hypothetical protein